MADEEAGYLLSSGSRAGEWKVGLFQCFDYPKNCLLTSCCPCIRFAHTASRAKLYPACFGFYAWLLVYCVAVSIFALPLVWPWCNDAYPIQPADPDYARQLLLPWCGVWWLALPVIVFVGTVKRYEIRQRTNIPATCGVAQDCLVHACCEPCAVAQEGAHVDLVERGCVAAECCMDRREYDTDDDKPDYQRADDALPLGKAR
ncbi:hypothetical protein M885DRAFT_526909 [Pelagophyceae sp. CCMP2097]|nr:hypothetical protein M885DRAFT_526909 [Pelagophyceae sp. CCMP2097]|mmetsp:Transcript_9778/g.32193  ORF Transcript_9778/g.32193 Transcript_9778/m.32193 type:complete len:202 (+) Transcript_9778:100-705(+)